MKPKPMSRMKKMMTLCGHRTRYGGGYHQSWKPGVRI
jgi:hypothetical protein